jgi:hypothetical protein
MVLHETPSATVRVDPVDANPTSNLAGVTVFFSAGMTGESLAEATASRHRRSWHRPFQHRHTPTIGRQHAEHHCQFGFPAPAPRSMNAIDPTC